MANEISIEDLRTLAQQAGLNIPDEELQRLLPGVNRAQKQAAELRALIDSGDEPAAIFIAAKKN
jgi:Ca2+-binding EF-hand superfamily protein